MGRGRVGGGRPRTGATAPAGIRQGRGRASHCGRPPPPHPLRAVGGHPPHPPPAEGSRASLRGQRPSPAAGSTRRVPRAAPAASRGQLPPPAAGSSRRPPQAPPAASRGQHPPRSAGSTRRQPRGAPAALRGQRPSPAAGSRAAGAARVGATAPRKRRAAQTTPGPPPRRAPAPHRAPVARRCNESPPAPQQTQRTAHRHATAPPCPGEPPDRTVFLTPEPPAYR